MRRTLPNRSIDSAGYLATMQVDRYRAKLTRAVAVTLSVISGRVLQWFRQLY